MTYAEERKQKDAEKAHKARKYRYAGIMNHRTHTLLAFACGVSWTAVAAVVFACLQVAHPSNALVTVAVVAFFAAFFALFAFAADES